MINAKIAVVGSRNYTNYKYISKILYDYQRKFGVGFVISGGAKGVDTLAEKWAKDAQIFGFTVYNAQWTKYGKRAGPQRNLLIAESCDVMIAFPSKDSKGTRNAIKQAKKLDKKVYIFEVEI